MEPTDQASDNRDVLCIYHGGCFDGFTAAWAFRKLYQGGGEVEYYGAHYGHQPPEIKGRHVYIVDFSYPPDVLHEIARQTEGDVLVLDHHKSAYEECQKAWGDGFEIGGTTTRVFGLQRVDPPNLRAWFDMERSGCGLTWDYFSAGQERPWLVDVMEDRDLWRFKYGNLTKRVTAVASATPMTFESWDSLAARDHIQIAVEGDAILGYIRTFGEKAVEQAVWHPIQVPRSVAEQVAMRPLENGETVRGEREGLSLDPPTVTIPMINVPYQNGSDHLHMLLEQYPRSPFAAAFHLRKDGHWAFSLRSGASPGQESIDVSLVASGYGGGGHRNAAGFIVQNLWFDVEKSAAAEARERRSEGRND